MVTRTMHGWETSISWIKCEILRVKQAGPQADVHEQFHKPGAPSDPMTILPNPARWFVWMASPYEFPSFLVVTNCFPFLPPAERSNWRALDDSVSCLGMPSSFLPRSKVCLRVFSDWLEESAEIGRFKFESILSFLHNAKRFSFHPRLLEDELLVLVLVLGISGLGRRKGFRKCRVQQWRSNRRPFCSSRWMQLRPLQRGNSEQSRTTWN